MKLVHHFLLLLAAFFVGCVGSGSQSTVHPDASIQPAIPGFHQKGKRQIAIFFDGTWNKLGDRTNVRRLYEMVAARHDPSVLCYYDQGVGTGKLGSAGGAVTRFFGGLAGQGFQKNLRDALVFVTEHYRPGDEISVFGFSRGSYCGLVFSTIIGEAGFPVLTSVDGQTVEQRHSAAVAAIGSFYSALEDAESVARKEANHAIGWAWPGGSSSRWTGRPAEEALAWRRAYWTSVTASQAWIASPGRYRPGTAALALWDPVEGMSWSLPGLVKTATSNSRKAEFERHQGHRFHPVGLGNHVKECYIAFSLDEQRQAFMPELPDHERGQPQHYEFVWFPGDHSDLGGGHGDGKDLAGLSMNWMLSKVGDRLLGSGGGKIRVHADPLAPRHDLEMFSLVHVRVRGEVFGPSAKCPVVNTAEPYAMTPVRSGGWKMKIHESALLRMQSGQDWFLAPKATQAVNLATYTPKAERNMKGPYCPRPFRQMPVADHTTGGWVDRPWTQADLRDHYEIVPF
ncbi:MAG: DUF2235 domain-containing protein [Verrucomicrobiales bacterium]|nr:DUF2235 domain-containing protein [Verrucomicrobiales bacterium]MCP5559592.1 DUF2235 domain-containing protein [Verrucomicrobiaceae bacterium]